MSIQVLKRERTVLRTSFTKAYNKLQELLKSTEVNVREEISSQLELMNLRLESISTKNSEISSLLYVDPDIDDQTLEEEQDKVDHYELMYLQAKKSAERFLLSDKAESIGTHSVNTSIRNELHSKYKFPVLKLRVFNGSLQDWLPFWSQFKKIQDNSEMHDVDKLGYLSMSMTSNSPAKQLIDSYPATGEMYGQVVQALQDRFGREDLLTEFYIRELLKLILHPTQLSLAQLYDLIQSHMRNLELLKITADNCAAILMPLVSSCLPSDLLQVWERNQYSRNKSSKECLINLLEFLKNEVEGSQKLELVKAGFGTPHVQPSPNKFKFDKREQKKNSTQVVVPTASGLINFSNKIFCLFCKGEHQAQYCTSSLTIEERRSKMKQSKVCFCCLKPGHRASHCKARPKCTLCGRSHYSIMCDKKDSSVVQNHSLASSTVQSNVLMQTIVVNLHGNQGKNKLARLLIDTGSQRSYILNSSAIEMGYVPHRKEKIQHALFGGKVSEVVECNVYKINISKLDGSYLCNFEVLSKDKICSPVPNIPEGPWIRELAKQNVVLSDTTVEHVEIEILVGSDIAGKLYTGNNIMCNSGLVAMETYIGWSLSGRLPNVKNEYNTNAAMLVTSLLIREANITDLWALDVLGINDPVEKACKEELEKATLNHFLSTVEINDENRIEVRLPFLANHPPLFSNYKLAIKRLDSNLKKLKCQNYLTDYQNVLDGWLEKGIIEKVPLKELDNQCHYLPHHHVIKLGSTTPVRPVFDASAKEGQNYSLNQCLEKGPNLIEKIFSCLAHFRSHKVAVSGDIEKAFLQISVHPKDRDYLRFLWRDKGGNLVIFRHCRVVFGVSCSPFLLEASIQLHIQNVIRMIEEGNCVLPLKLVKQLSESFYVDNALTSLDTEEEADEFIRVASTVMKEKQFDLRGWEKSGDVDFDKPSNVLGLLWYKTEDILSINVKSLLDMKFEKVTKKILLSAAHRLYDPIGVTCSVGLIPKLLVQETWKEKYNWNEEVSFEIQEKFCSWLSEIYYLSEIKIPRWILKSDQETENMSLHVFSDACKTSYAAVVFLRVQYGGVINLRLLAAKARVAPTGKKGMTIPRLELLGASIATRLYKNVVQDFKLSHVNTIFWTDATTVLAWIKRQEPWDVYVMNRIKEIRDLSQGCTWKYVPGEYNPADLPSRGTTPKNFVKSKWWEGPSWLKENPEDWPNENEIYDEHKVNVEKKKTVVSMTAQPVVINQNWYFSQYSKIVRMIAWILRFKENCLYKGRHGHLPTPTDVTANEYCKAERKLFLLVQREAFDGIKDKRLSNLMPFIDENGIIRLKTKISNRPDSEDFCYPIVLPNTEHPVVHRLIMEEHKNNSHAGTQTLLAITRKRFWIIGGRRTIKSVVSKCITCKKFTEKHLEAEPTPLPEKRVCDSRVFETTGVDFAGPLYVKNNNGIMKVWVCIFTCAVYRAVRLELVPTLSTYGFVQALRRFISRQGRPCVIYSDNGTNFVGFNNACAQIDWTEICKYTSVKRIEWRFNPPSAPWWGGWWERMVRTLKELLRRVLGRTSVEYIELQTILCECEATINSRPLTYLSCDTSDLYCITPKLFLQDIQEVEIPEYQAMQGADLRGKVKNMLEVRRQLMERFRLEYLGSLQLFQNSKGKSCDVKLGDIVLIGDDTLKRVNWPIGRVTKLIKGTDGKVRVLEVRTSKGLLLRPIQRIFPLECNSNSDLYSFVNDQSVIDMEHDSNPIVEYPKQSHDKVVQTRRGRIVKLPSRFSLD